MLVPFEIAERLETLGYPFGAMSYYNRETKEIDQDMIFYPYKALSAPYVEWAIDFIREEKGIACGVYPTIKKLKDQDKPIGVFYEYCFIDYNRNSTVKINDCIHR